MQWPNNQAHLIFGLPVLNMRPPGGAGSEVWNRVYMIAPLKKFGRVRLSTNFPWKQIWRRMGTWKDDEVLLSFKSSRAQISRKGFYELFLMDFLDIRRRDLWTVHGWLHLSWFEISASSVIIFERPSCSNSYIFPLTVVLRLSSLS